MGMSFYILRRGKKQNEVTWDNECRLFFSHAITLICVKGMEKKKKRKKNERQNKTSFNIEMWSGVIFYLFISLLSSNCFQFYKYVGSPPLIANPAQTGFSSYQDSSHSLNLISICHAEMTIFSLRQKRG